MVTIVKALACAGIAVAVLAGCQKKEEAGTAETIGRKIDQAAAQGAVELNRMGEHAGRALEKAGEKLQRKSEQAQDQNSSSDSKDSK